MNKRIILVGPSAAGKNYLRNIFADKGFTHDVSYTSREKRPGEIEGEDYHFIPREEFERKIKDGEFYEWTEYKGNLYGTGLKEWNERDIFIMESVGVSKIHPEDRKKCFVIYLNPPHDSRIKRMAIEREWKWEEIARRLDFDQKCFNEFKDFDIEITNAYF